MEIGQFKAYYCIDSTGIHFRAYVGSNVLCNVQTTIFDRLDREICQINNRGYFTRYELFLQRTAIHSRRDITSVPIGAGLLH